MKKIITSAVAASLLLGYTASAVSAQPVDREERGASSLLIVLIVAAIIAGGIILIESSEDDDDLPTSP